MNTFRYFAILYGNSFDVKGILNGVMLELCMRIRRTCTKRSFKHLIKFPF